MLDSLPAVTALTAPTRFVESRGRRLAYRSIGEGQPIVLCTRFRGTLDTWDPAFLDALAGQGFRVVTFDYSGLGQSTGTRSYNPADLAADARDLMDALDLHDVVLGGWSLGGIAAQVALALFPARISHLLLIGTTPPGPVVKPAEQLFYDTAVRETNDLEDEMILFFEPASAGSRAAGTRSVERIAAALAARPEGRSVPVPAAWAAAYLGTTPKTPPFPADAVLDLFKTTTVPILHIGGDHDIIFPVENWYALNRALPTLRLVTFPAAGHGPQHQFPEAAAAHVAAFVRHG